MRDIPKTYHVDNLRVYVLGNNTTLGCDVFQHFVQCLCLDLFAFEFCTRVIKIEKDTALMELLDEQLGAFVWRSFWR